MSPSDPPAESINSVLANHPYRAIRFLGRGGVGEVWVVQNTRMGRLFAMKVLHKHLVNDRFFVERFELEARATASLDHPNIVSISDYWVADDCCKQLIKVNAIVDRSGYLARNDFDQVKFALKSPVHFGAVGEFI